MRPCGCTEPGRPVWREAGYTGLRCACGLVYLDPPAATPAVGADRHSDGYYAFPAELRLAWMSQFSPHGKLLEVGPGAGHLLAAARRRGFEIAGVDPNPASARRIRARLGIEIEQATIETSRLPDAAYDVVVHVDLLAHFVDPVAALVAMRRRLRAGGHVCFEVGVLGGISTAWLRAIGPRDVPEHRWMFSRGAIDRVLARAGLRIVATRRFGLLPALAVLLARRAAGDLALRIAGYPQSSDGLPPPQNAAHRLYDRVTCLARYRLGRVAPPIGPQTLFVAARAA